MRLCNECNIWKDMSCYEINASYTTRIDYKRKCKDCRKKHGIVLRKLHKQHSKPEPGYCPICNDFTEKWVLDHDHVTQQFRGWLCNSCNTALGKFKENVLILEKAIKYIQNVSI